MKVFMTGATGYIGSAVASALLNAGHEVTAVARPGSKRFALERAGVRVVDGAIETLDALRPLIGDHDAFIHAAAAAGDAAPGLDAITLDTLLGSSADGKTFVYTSGVWVLGSTGEQSVDEASPTNPLPIVAWRPEHERRVLEAANGGFVTAVVRPGCVYGGSQGLFADWFASAAEGRPLEMVGDGANRWAMVYLDDVADCYVRVIETKAAGIIHAVDDSRSTIAEIARAIAESGGRGSEVRTMPLEVARAAMGPFADALAADQRVSSRGTRDTLSWEPSCESLLTTLERQWNEWRAAVAGA